MSKATELCKRMMKDLEANWLLHIEDINFHKDFGVLYKLGYSQKVANTIFVFVILSYDSDSNWINLSRDRFDDKLQILKGLGVEETDGTFKSIFLPILEYNNDEVQEVILNFLLNHTDHRWQEIHSLFDSATKNIRFANQRTLDKTKTGSSLDEETNQHVDTYEEVDEEAQIKIRNEKQKLLATAISNRQLGEEILAKLKKDYVKTDHAVQQDFSFNYSDSAKTKIDVMSWRSYVKRRNELRTNNL